MKRLLIIAVVVLFASPLYAAQTTVNTSSDSFETAWGRQQAMNTELYGWTSQDVSPDANPAFNSAHATSGNLAAANAQVTKKWITGLDYVADVTSVVYGGAIYICTSNHTAGASTEPGVGGSWATVWKFWGAALYEPLKGADDNYVTDAEKVVIGNTSGTNTGDQDLSGYVQDSDFSANGIMKRTGAGAYGQATSSDVIATFAAGSCSGYLKSDGSCDNPAGSGDMTKAAYDTGDNSKVDDADAVTTSDSGDTDATWYLVIVDGATGTQVMQTDSGISFNASTNRLTVPGGIDIPATALGPQLTYFLEDSDNGSNYVGWGSPASNNNDLILLIPSSAPSGELLSCAAPSSVTFSDGVARDASVCSWENNNKDDAIEFVIDGGGSAITTGIKGDLEAPWTATINRVSVLCDQSTTTTIDVWKDTYANYPPTDADSITSSAVPGTSAGLKDQDATLTGWTTSITAGDTIRFNVDANDNATRCTISLKVTKS